MSPENSVAWPYAPDPTPAADGPLDILKEALEYFEAQEKLGYPEYIAICSFNGWEIQQTKGKRTP